MNLIVAEVGQIDVAIRIVIVQVAAHGQHHRLRTGEAVEEIAVAGIMAAGV